MSKYNCDKCGKEFTQKRCYTKHINKKKHCITENVVDKNIENNHSDSKTIEQQPLSIIDSLTTHKEIKYIDLFCGLGAFHYAFNSLKNEFPGGNIKSVCGFSSHKDIGENIKIIASFSQKIYLISPKHPRAMPYEELRSVIHDTMHNFISEKALIYENDWTKGKVSLNVLCSFIDSVLSDQQEIIVICGSFFLMSEARNSLGYLEERDPIELNEFDGSVKFSL